VNENGIEAKYENGVLEVVVPKAEIVKPKKISVAIGEQKQKTVEASATESVS
jgi:predicted DNA-binding antitoxin AbrB/MazE fold protein